MTSLIVFVPPSVLSLSLFSLSLSLWGGKELTCALCAITGLVLLRARALPIFGVRPLTPKRFIVVVVVVVVVRLSLSLLSFSSLFLSLSLSSLFTLSASPSTSPLFHLFDLFIVARLREVSGRERDRRERERSAREREREAPEREREAPERETERHRGEEAARGCLPN